VLGMGRQLRDAVGLGLCRQVLVVVVGPHAAQTFALLAQSITGSVSVHVTIVPSRLGSHRGRTHGRQRHDERAAPSWMARDGNGPAHQLAEDARQVQADTQTPRPPA